MKRLMVAVSNDSYFTSSVINHIYDLGHFLYIANVNKKSTINFDDIPELNKDVLSELDIYVSSVSTEEKISIAGVNVTLSIVELSDFHHYELSWLAVTSEGYHELQSIILDLSDSINGADIYVDILSEAIQLLSSVLTVFAIDTLNVLGKSVSKHLITNQVNLEEIKHWHQSNQTENIYQIPLSISEEFESIVKKYANNVAVIFENNEYSYRQLLNVSNQVAVYVSSRLTFDSESKTPVVALVLHKSIELYASIIGVMKAGATYVSIDPEYPEERVNTITKTAKPDLLITQSNVNIIVDTNINIVNVEDLKLDPNVFTLSSYSKKTPVNNSAVLIYTSGSTGVPKGVTLSHKNILHFCKWYKGYVCLEPNSKALQFTTVSFDASLLDIFPTLLSGAQLVVPNNEQRHDFDQLNELVVSNQVTHSFIPPAMLEALPDYQWPSMTHIITGGDVCNSITINRWSKNRVLHNIYGPTECTVLAVTERFYEGSNSKIIGKPISNTKVYILDESSEPVTTNTHGELYISGEGVGQGYYNQPVMTKEKYVKNIFSNKTDDVMYKTGDTCCWDEFGKIRFIGRTDNQLKIRGFRVELGEIENVILNTNLYDKCIVTSNTKKQIMAYVIGPVDNATIEMLEDELILILPNYMLPTNIVEVDSFPSTANGKIDRDQLLKLSIPEKNSIIEEIYTETESLLRGIWTKLLELDDVDISLNDSFFYLGGHSLLVSKMLLEVKNKFSGNFSLARFMENPTIKGLSSLLTQDDLQKGDQISERIYSDIILDSNIKPLDSINTNAYSPKAVLLTGANGFLGVHIIDELIQNTNADIYCLIRASSIKKGYEKLHDAFQKYDINNLISHKRIIVQTGDLSAPLLGLSEECFNELSERIDIIYHNGAQVNHIYDYDYLYDTNVRSTLDLLRLATTYKNKQIVYISTLSAASNVNSDGRLIEDGPSEFLPAFVNNGYNLTKWVSEHLVWQAKECGLPVTIVRPGNICGHSKTGHCFPDQNRILLLLKGSAQLGYAPDWDTSFDLCPVDFIAKGIIVCTTDANDHASVLHFHNPMPLKWREYVDRLNYLNVPIKLIPAKKWQNMLFDLNESNALFNVVSFYLDDDDEDIGDISHIDHHKTLAKLKCFGMDYPVKDNALIDSNLGFLIKSGFIEQSFKSEKEKLNF